MPALEETKRQSFNVDDIHRLREMNYLNTCHMSAEERRKYYRERADKVQAEVDRLRQRGRIGRHNA